MTRKLFALLLALLFVASAQPASTEVIPFASTLISSSSVSMTVSGNTVTAKTNLKCKKSVEKLGVQSITIYKKRNSSWVAVKSSSGLYKTNSSSHTTSLAYNGSAGKEYYAKVVFYAKDGATKESKTRTSSTVTT